MPLLLTHPFPHLSCLLDPPNRQTPHQPPHNTNSRQFISFNSSTVLVAVFLLIAIKTPNPIPFLLHTPARARTPSFLTLHNIELSLWQVMGVPVMCRFGGSDAGSICPITGPSLLSRLMSISGIETAFHPQSFLKWSALLLALVAALTSVAKRFSRLIVKLQLQTHNNKLGSASQPQAFDWDDLSDDDEDTNPSTSDDEAEPSSSFHRGRRSGGYEDFRVAGSGDRVSWSDFDADEDGSVVSLWEGDASSQLEVPAGESRSPSSAVVKLWDKRMGRRSPVICGEWPTGCGKLVDDASSETWWDADAIVVWEDWFGKSAANGRCESVVTRCRDMVRQCLF